MFKKIKTYLTSPEFYRAIFDQSIKKLPEMTAFSFWFLSGLQRDLFYYVFPGWFVGFVVGLMLIKRFFPI